MIQENNKIKPEILVVNIVYERFLNYDNISEKARLERAKHLYYVEDY